MAEDLFITRTKLLIPQRRKELLSRTRLLSMFSDLLDYRLIIIAAPAGYGKTSLLIDFASNFEWPVCWYTLDQLDNDLHRFLIHFIHAIRMKFPGFGEESLNMLRSTNEEEIKLDFLISLLTNEIFDSITEHFIIVLDDFHLLEPTPEINQFLSNFIQRADDNCHIVITSRRLLTLPDLPLMVARSQVGGLSIEELAFIPEEVQALYSQIFQQEISFTDAADITGQSEGWITGLLLTSQVKRNGLGEPVKVSRASGIGLYEYLAQQVFTQQPRKIREFLLQSAILEEFNAEMCQMIIGKAIGKQENWQQFMDEVVRSNLFVLPVDEELQWLRYHHLFRDFLQNQINNEQPELVEKIRLNQAEYFLGKKDWERVFDIYSSLRETDAIIQLIKNVGSSFIAKGKIKKLSAWLEKVPDNLLNIDPTLLSIQATVSVNRGSVQEGKQILDRVIEMLQSKNAHLELAENLIRRSTALRVLGNYEAAVDDAERAIKILENNKQLKTTLSEAYRTKGAAFYQIGELEKGFEFLSRALDLCESEDEDEGAARILVELGAIQVAQGELQDAQQSYEKSLAYWESAGDSIWVSTILNNLAVLQHSAGQYFKSFHNLEKSMHYSQITGNHRMEGYSLASIGDLYKDLGASKEALGAYRKSLEIAQRISDQFLILYLKIAGAHMDIISGNYQQAEMQLETAFAIAQKNASRYESNKCLLEKSALELARGNLKSASESISLAEIFFSKQGHIEEYMRSKVIQFITRIKLGNSNDFKKSALELVREIEDPANHQPFVLAASEFQKQLRNLSQRSDIGKEVSTILRHVADFQEKAQKSRRDIRKHASVVPFGSARIMISAFGNAEIVLKDKPLTISDWKTQTSRDLFFLFLANPEGLSKEEVGIIFWPDSTEAELKLRFKNAIYRMRRAIGPEAVLFQDGFYQFNRSIDYEYDVQNFLSAIENARIARSDQEKINFLKAAVDQYKGVYLPEIDELWVVADRQRYLNHYIKVVEELLSLFMNNKEFESALFYCEKALLQDLCNEELHRIMMNVHALMGNKAAVSRQYETCTKILEKNLGTEPSHQTRTLYKSLMA